MVLVTQGFFGSESILYLRNTVETMQQSQHNYKLYYKLYQLHEVEVIYI